MPGIVVGTDPGTKSLDAVGMRRDGTLVLDESFEYSQLPGKFLESLQPLAREIECLIAPSGYGTAFKKLSDSTGEDLREILPKEDPRIPVNETIRTLYQQLRHLPVPAYLLPGVIHLPTVPWYRKTNKMDMGTADKLCVAALGIYSQVRRFGLQPSETSFILLEVGYGFNACLVVKGGKVIDGLGGTSGSLGFLSPGALDAELAIRIPSSSQYVLFTSGARALAGGGIEPEELPRHDDAWRAFVEGMKKMVAQMLVTLPDPLELIISGRLSTLPELREEIELSYGSKFKLHWLRDWRRGRKAKEAAEGACILAAGMVGWEPYREIFQTLEIERSSGRIWDHVKMEVPLEY